MELIEIFGYFMALLIGMTLGLIGGGGSILTVPVLAYLFLLDEKVATAYSLFIVGGAALLGSLQQAKNKNVDWPTAIVFGIPAMVGVWLVRHYVVPALPDVLFSTGDFDFTRRMGMFGLFIILMIVAAYSMIFDRKKVSVVKEKKYNFPLIFLEGIVVGSLTGLVGAGGGFLIIPALVLLANLDMKLAVGTSLVIVAVKSLIGFFLGDALTMTIDWPFLLKFTSITLIGITLGIYISKFIDGPSLKKCFGYFVVIMAMFMFVMEFII